jgi:hypothetical protein
LPDRGLLAARLYRPSRVSAGALVFRERPALTPCGLSASRISLPALKHGDASRRHGYALMGAGIAPDARAALPGRECSEASDLNAVAVGERICNRIENGVDCGFGITVMEAGICTRDAFHQFRFDHREPRIVQSFAVGHHHPCRKFYHQKRVAANGEFTIG